MISSQSLQELRNAVAWCLGRRDFKCHLPFYCDPARVGSFAVSPQRLASGEDDALFQLFITLSMYQGVRDVIIMDRQRQLPRAAMRVLADAGVVSRAIANHPCPVLLSSDAFEHGCDVAKHGDVVDCGQSPGRRCHVKDATKAFNRMGDMGKLPTSAWLRIWENHGLQELLSAVCRAEDSPIRRAALLVTEFGRVHRVGRKLATMFVSALSTPSLAAGLTPWFPLVDGNHLVVVDVNVARAVDALRQPNAPRTYDARALWVCEQAREIDLRAFGAHFPRYSPRLVQECLYAFGSRSNRVAHGDPCAVRSTECGDCARSLCPFRRTVGESAA